MKFCDTSVLFPWVCGHFLSGYFVWIVQRMNVPSILISLVPHLSHPLTYCKHLKLEVCEPGTKATYCFLFQCEEDCPVQSFPTPAHYLLNMEPFDWTRNTNSQEWLTSLFSLLGLHLHYGDLTDSSSLVKLITEVHRVPSQQYVVSYSVMICYGFMRAVWSRISYDKACYQTKHVTNSIRVYTVEPLIRTPFEPRSMPWLVTCPYFKERIISIWDSVKCPD